MHIIKLRSCLKRKNNVKKTKIFLLLVILAVLIASCNTPPKKNTGMYIIPGEEVVFDYVCDNKHEFGVWAMSVTASNGASSKSSIGISVRMTEEEYIYYCLEMK